MLSGNKQHTASILRLWMYVTATILSKSQISTVALTDGSGKIPKPRVGFLCLIIQELRLNIVYTAMSRNITQHYGERHLDSHSKMVSTPIKLLDFRQT